MKYSVSEATEASCANPESFARRVCSLMPLILRNMMRQERNYLSKGMLTLPQFHVLQFLGSSEAFAMKAAARALGMKASTMTGIVDRLNELGLVRRRRGEADRRAVLVNVTPKGLKILEQLRKDRARSVARVFGGLTVTDRRAYLNILEKVAGGLEPATERKKL